MKCESFLRNDYSHALAHGSGPWRGKVEGEGRTWRSVANHQDSVAATEEAAGQVGARAAAPCCFAIDYRGALLCARGDLTRPTPFQSLPAGGFSLRAAC